MKTRPIAILLGAIAACGTPYSSNDPSPEAGAPPPASTTTSPDGGPDTSSPALPECGAQRVVNLVAGNGGLGWFTLVWPLPDVITGYQNGYAYDNPQNAALVVSSADHPLYARTVGTETSLEGTGKHPFVSAFVAGTNQTHTQAPSMTTTSHGLEVLGLATLVQQKALAPKVPIVTTRTGVYQKYATGPDELLGTSADDLATQVAAAAAVDKTTLVPDALTLASWTNASASGELTELTKLLYFAAKSFEQGLVGTVIAETLPDNPENAFAGGMEGMTPDTVVHILDSFYSELSKVPEPACGHLGQRITLADNTVLLVTGDGPRDPYQASPWSTATPGAANLMYVRSNGYLVPGWFGRITSTARVNFDPTSGVLSDTADIGPSTDASVVGLLFAIVRGDMQTVSLTSITNYSGVIAPPP